MVQKKVIKKIKTYGDMLWKRKVEREAYNIFESKFAGVYNKTGECNCMM